MEIVIFISIRPIINKHEKPVHLEDLTQQVGAGDIIRSKSCDKLKKYLHYQSGEAMKSHKPLITWSCKIVRKAKTIISSLAQCLWPPNLAGWWLTLMDSCLWIPTTLWSRGLVKLRENLKSLYLHYHSAYVHQTRQDGDLPWLSFTHKSKLPCNHLVLWEFATD